MRYAFDFEPLDGGTALEITDRYATKGSGKFVLVMDMDDFAELGAKAERYRNSLQAAKNKSLQLEFPDDD